MSTMGLLVRTAARPIQLGKQQMAQMLAAREAVGNYQPPKGDWRSASVQELIALERQRPLLWAAAAFLGGSTVNLCRRSSAARVDEPHAQAV